MFKIIGEGFSTKKNLHLFMKKLVNSLWKFFSLFIKIQNKILFFLNEADQFLLNFIDKCFKREHIQLI